MNTAFDTLGSVSPGRESWRFKVRVLRLWSVSSFSKPDMVNSLEMVLIDDKGMKIHATVRRQLLYLFSSKIAEGNVYKMSFFVVASESGLYRTTSHPYKLIFEMKTKVQICENHSIDRYGLSLTTIEGIVGYGADHDFLIDVVGLITGISAEREYIRDGKVTKMILLELSDNSGKIECALFGDYVEFIQQMLVKSGDVLPVIVVQFAKIKNFGGKLSIQNVLNATRIYVHPSIPEVLSFKKVLVIDGVESSCVTIPAIGGHARPSFEEDFLINYPHTSIADLVGSAEDGIYVICAVVDGLVDEEDWWYPACRCHRSLSSDSGAYYCKHCDKHVFKMVPRFRVKVKVDDGTSEAVFVVFDADMNLLVGKHCFELVGAAKGQNGGYYPSELEALKGKKFLFKVQKISSGALRFEDSFRVKRICSDADIMENFDESLAKVDSDSDDEKDGEEEPVEDTQDEEFVEALMVTPANAKAKKEIDVSSGDLGTEVVDLGDNSNKCLEIFVPGRVGLNVNEVISVKRNLSAAFSECTDVEASTSKSGKLSDD